MPLLVAKFAKASIWGFLTFGNTEIVSRAKGKARERGKKEMHHVHAHLVLCESLAKTKWRPQSAHGID
jgi:hypothetical protein